MDLEIINALQTRAKKIMWHVGRRYGEDFAGFTWANYAGAALEYTLPEPGKIVFAVPGTSFANIAFYGVTPTKVTRKILHEPIVTGSTINDLNSIAVTNTSAIVPIERTYDLTINETKTFNEAVGVGVEVGLLQKISYGGAASPVSGETSLSLSISTTYDKEWGGSSSVTRETSSTIEVPPMTVATLTSKSAVSNFEQRCEYWCDLEHEVILFSHQDFRHIYSSMAELKRCVDGRSPDTVPQAATWRANRLPQIDSNWMTQPLEIYYDEVITFDKANTGDTTLSTKPYVSA